MQLSIYFKLGFSKARNIAISIPVLALMALSGVFSYTIFKSINEGTSLEPVVDFLNSVGFMAIIVLVLAVAVVISYRFSLSFHQKQDF
jgi:uncharacterized protein involved in cysteine biosynthesis